VYGVYGSDFSLSTAFALVAIFNLVRQGFVGLPITFVLGEMYLSTFKRIQEFVIQPDITPVPKLASGEVGIEIKDADFQWSTAETTTLKSLNLKAKKGDFVMVVGPVGSGKSSLVSSILGELPIKSGSLGVSGNLAYVAQEAFIFNATVRENIIFGKPYDAEKYRKVIEASALMADLGQFAAGDRTEIGERGVNLSGGQKQRISIARALYSDADIILLDDPLSAVDAHVGKHLFHKAVRGYLADKLVLLTANQLQYLPYADHIIFLSQGDTVAAGTFDELMKSNAMFKDQMIKFGVTGKPEEGSEEEPEPKKVEQKPSEKPTVEPVSNEKNDKKEDSGTLIVSEGKQEGLIGWNVYWYYFKKGGLGVFFTVIIFLALSVGARVVSGWWISVWLSQGATTGYVLTNVQCKSTCGSRSRSKF
jgi:ATP-binding cassette subfamily C (CFTR/MRP) protein 5